MTKSEQAYQKVNEWLKANPEGNKSQAFKAVKCNPALYYNWVKNVKKPFKTGKIMKPTYAKKIIKNTRVSNEKIADHKTSTARDVLNSDLHQSTKVFILKKIFA